MNKIYLLTVSILCFFIKSNLQAQDAAYTMTATTKTITSCRSTLSSDNSCKVAGNWLYCNSVDRSYTFISSAGTIMNANLTAHVIADDFIYVYDGPSSASPLIATWTGGTGVNWATGLNATSTGSVITIRFVSNGSNQGNISFIGGGNYSGFDILIGCQPGNCNGNPPASDNCTTAPQICNLNGYCGNTSGWYNEDNAQLEGQLAPGFTGSIENNSWINFVASAGTATLVVTSANCLTTTSGIQGAVYASTNCSTFTPVSGGSFNQNLASGTVTLSLTGLTAGQDYYLMLDGYNGNVCDYTVTAIGNVQTLATTSSASSNTICPNQQFTVTATPGATSYSWSPAPASTSSNIAVYNNISSTSVISTTAFGYCGPSATVALTMSVVPLTISVTSATICSGASTVLTASGATNYTWSPGGQTTTTISVNPASTTVYTVTGVTGICSDVKTGTVTVSSIPTTTASTTGSLSCTNTLVTLSSTLAGQSYTWVAPAGGNLGTPNAQNTSASGAGGTYSLFVQSAAGCTYSTTTSVTQNTVIPTGVSAGPNGTLSCAAGSSVALNGSVATPTNATASWSGANFCGNPTNTFITAACGAGVYTLTATNPANGCTAMSTMTVSPSAGAPTVTNNPVTNTITCTNTLVTVSISTTATPVSYTWTGTGINSGSSTGTITVTQGGTFNYSVTSGGCTTSGSQNVASNLTPSVTTASTNGTLTCAVTTVTLSSTLAGVNYTWTAPAGGSVASPNSQNTTASGKAGTYTLTIVGANGCPYTTTTSVTQNTVQPSFTASTTGTLTCAVSSVTLNTSFAASGYTWTAPAGGSVSSANTQTTLASGAAGNYTLTAMSPVNGCTNTAVTSVAQNITPPSTSASVTTSVTCVTNTVTLTSTLGSGVTYTWTPPAGGSIVSGMNSQNAVGSGTGTYTLVITDTGNGCTFTTTAIAGSDLSAPTGVNAGTSQTLTCAANASVTLTGSASTPANAAANWLGGVCGSTTNFTTDACAAGIYTLVVTNPNTGCTSSSTVQVFSAPGAPTLTIAPITNSITCTNTLVSIEMQTTETTYSVSWSGPAIVGSTTTNTIDVIQGGVYTVVITNTVSACSTPSNVTVFTNTTSINPSINGNLNLTCSTTLTTLDATPSGGAYSYSWTGPGVVSGAGTGTITANAPGVYSLNVTETANGCSGTASVTVIQNGTLPTATITPVSSNSVITCSNTSVNLIVNTTPSTDMTYVWSNTFTTQTTNVTGAGTYSVLVTNTVTGCSGSSVITITNNIVPPTVSVADATIACGAPSTTIEAIASNVAYAWTTTNGTIVAGSSASTPTVGSAGQYVVTVTDNVNGCTNTGTVNVSQNSISTSISANPTSGTAPLSVDFTNNSVGGSVFSWNFGDTNNNTSSISAPSHTYNTVGTYVVTFTVTDVSGLCSATASISIDVFENSLIIVPNVFTPNGDNANDVFKITTVGIKTLTCDIFNRWGQKMFTINSPTDSWDGKAPGGGASPDGTYFYILKATGFDDKDYEQQGYLTLFR